MDFIRDVLDGSCATRYGARHATNVAIRYDRCMEDVPTRDLRNRTRAVLDRVAAGASFRITDRGKPVATLVPWVERRTWIPKEEFLRIVGTRQADPQLTHDLRELAPDTTDDLDDPS